MTKMKSTPYISTLWYTLSTLWYTFSTFQLYGTLFPHFMVNFKFVRVRLFYDLSLEKMSVSEITSATSTV